MHVSFDSRVILVVDDEPVITQTLTLVLNRSNQGLFAIESNDLEQALQIVHGIRPDLVLLDVQMPGAENLEHAIEMRDRCRCKVLLMSGQPETAAAIEQSHRAGHHPFEIIAKPIHPSDLINKIHQMLTAESNANGQSSGE